MEKENKNNLTNELVKKGAKLFLGKFSLLFKIKFLVLSGCLLVAVLLFIGTLVTFQNSALNSKSANTTIIFGNKNLSPEVLKWQSSVEKYANKYGIPELVPYALALMQVETGGRMPDLMQSSESKGLPVNTLQYEESIDQGLKHLSNVYNIAKSFNLQNNYPGIVQAYNYGVAYMYYLGSKHVTHSIETAEAYSKNVVAPSLGNTSGQTYSYVNEVSIKFGKTYLYLNGGNYLYSELVNEYVGSSESGSGSGGNSSLNPSEFYNEMKKEMEKFQGWPYVWGGKSPQSGFDCSGLTSYLYKKILNVSIESYTVTQYSQTVPVSIKEAKSGDLIFFRGTYGAPDFISHVGIYVNPTTMFDSDGNGIGYHNWQDPYWKSHSPEIRRVKR